MEYCEGGDILRKITKQGGLTEAKAANYIR